jgi:hypothetical protein
LRGKLSGNVDPWTQVQSEVQFVTRDPDGLGFSLWQAP